MFLLQVIFVFSYYLGFVPVFFGPCPSSSFFFFSFCGSLAALPLTKIGKKRQSTGQRSLENNVLMDFLFGLFSVTAALPKQAFQKHSAVWDVILIKNTVENWTLPLEKNQVHLPPFLPPVISQAIFVFYDWANSQWWWTRETCKGTVKKSRFNKYDEGVNI